MRNVGTIQCILAEPQVVFLDIDGVMLPLSEEVEYFLSSLGRAGVKRHSQR